MEPVCLKRDSTVFLMIDVQEKLVPAAYNGDSVVKESWRLLKSASVLDIPVIITEQYPKGLGSTHSQLAEFTAIGQRIEKTSFSCFGALGFADVLAQTGRKTVVCWGIESHVCVFATAMELKKRGYEVIVVDEACGSRKQEHLTAAMRNLMAAGIAVLPVETVVYQLLEKSGTPEFKKLLPVFK